MVPKSNLGGHSIFFFLHPSTLGRGILPPTHCAHSGDFVGDRKCDFNVSYFLILIKAYSIFICTHFTWFFFVPFTLVGDEWEDEYASFGPKSSGVHPINSQSVSLPIKRRCNSMVDLSKFTSNKKILSKIVTLDYN